MPLEGLHERYINFYTDFAFKKLFGTEVNKELLRSFLNALLPFDRPEEEIESIEYLPAELVPDTPLRKNSIVDVRCRDARGWQFIVEMQMVWSPEFQQRVLFNAAKAYVRQSDKGDDYRLLEPVYSLNLVNEVFEPDLAGYYHYYRMVHVEHSEKVIDGLNLVFVELPKFRPDSFSQKKMQVLWLRYLTEIGAHTTEVPAELLDNPDICRAVTAVEEAAYTEAQLLGYDKFWDIISVERTLYNSGLRKGRAEGREEGIAEGREQGRAEGREQGRHEAVVETARRMKVLGLAPDVIAGATGLTADDIRKL